MDMLHYVLADHLQQTLGRGTSQRPSASWRDMYADLDRAARDARRAILRAAAGTVAAVAVVAALAGTADGTAMLVAGLGR